MNGFVEKRYEKYGLENYVLEIMTMGLCKLFVPVSFVSSEEGINAMYKVEDYRNLITVQSMEIEDVLNVVISLIRGIEAAEKHYIFFEEYEVDSSVIYVNKDYSEAKIVFIPIREEKTDAEKVANLLNELREKCSKEGKKYIEKATEYVKCSSFSYRNMLHCFEGLRKEVYLCNVK